MIICKCDRCQLPFEPESDNMVNAVVKCRMPIKDTMRGVDKERMIHLCPECWVSFEEWMMKVGDQNG